MKRSILTLLVLSVAFGALAADSNALARAYFAIRATNGHNHRLDLYVADREMTNWLCDVSMRTNEIHPSMYVKVYSRQLKPADCRPGKCPGAMPPSPFPMEWSEKTVRVLALKRGTNIVVAPKGGSLVDAMRVGGWWEVRNIWIPPVAVLTNYPSLK